MSDKQTADGLVEIGTEELPPKALRNLIDAFADGVAAQLRNARLAHGGIEAYASPRRLALHIRALAPAQDDQRVQQKGPPVSVAFDQDGKPTKAATAFAAKCGVAVESLERIAADKGAWLGCSTLEKGRTLDELLPALVDAALAALPIPRRMRWGSRDDEFVRPVHWVVLMHGARTVPGTVLGIETGNRTQGHRYMSGEPLTLSGPGEYADRLYKEGFVIASFDARRQAIEQGVAACAKGAGGQATGDDALYDEVTALTEWPVPLAGAFDTEFLELPREVIVASLTGHQRYFPVCGADGRLLPTFIAVANIESRDPEQVRRGNERVLRPRLADAAFFWDADRRVALGERRPQLAGVVYQRGLGTLADKAERVAALAVGMARALGRDSDAARRAAELAKCDLLTGMVGEFPELQGVMGAYYARAGGEPDAVADAIGEQYLPRFAGDAVPATPVGQVLAFADKLDTLAGIFVLGRKPSGNRDPFGLRRAALGLVRIATECRMDVDLVSLIDTALGLQPANAADDVAGELYDFIVDRMRGLLMERGETTSEEFDAVRGRRPSSLLDIGDRVGAVRRFAAMESAASLAAANKRIANILRQAGSDAGGEVDSALLEPGAEQALYDAVIAAGTAVGRLQEERRYGDVLARLAELRAPVDAYFDGVMVMADDDAVRRNRLALLGQLHAMFLDVADISRLSIDRR